MNTEDRFLGCLFGLACGDAVGAPMEGWDRGERVVTDMESGGVHRVDRGQWTDDTSMALCLAQSLVSCLGFDATDQMRRYVRWLNEGYYSSRGRCFGIGTTTRYALTLFQNDDDPYAGKRTTWSSGNGCIMRLAPVPMYFASDRDEAIRMSSESSLTTHGAAECVESCRLFGAMIVDALRGRSKQEILTGHGMQGFESARLNQIARGGYLTHKKDEIAGTGYVVACLEAALWCFAHTESYEEAVLAAANLGDDTDTTAAVCGQLAGAYYGLRGIPQRWIEWVAMRDSIRCLAESLFHRSSRDCDAKQL